MTQEVFATIKRIIIEVPRKDEETIPDYHERIKDIVELRTGKFYSPETIRRVDKFESAKELNSYANPKGKADTDIPDDVFVNLLARLEELEQFVGDMKADTETVIKTWLNRGKA